jgi:hypothetical protein
MHFTQNIQPAFASRPASALNSSCGQRRHNQQHRIGEFARASSN